MFSFGTKGCLVFFHRRNQRQKEVRTNVEELSFSVKRSVRRYEAVETDGLTLYPIRVSEYESF